MRWVRVLVPVLLVAVVIVVVVTMLTARPDLRRSQKSVDQAWTPLASQLGSRYAGLDQTDEQLRQLTGPVRQIADQVNAAYANWQTATTKGGNTTAQVRAANTLESYGRRLVTAAQSSDRVKANPALLAAVNSYANDATFANAGVLQNVAAYNAAVEKYERDRSGPLRSFLASVMGTSEVPAFAPAPA